MENRLKKGLGRGLSSLLGDSSKKINTNKYQKTLLPFVDEFDKKYYLQKNKSQTNFCK